MIITRAPRLIKNLAAEIVDSLILGDKTLFSLFYNDYPPKEYLHYHAINVTIMSAGLALVLKYNKSRVNELAIASFLHDIGMIKLENIVQKPGPLSDEEYAKIKEHPSYSIEMLSEVKNISRDVICAIKDQHECFDGKGYPQGIKNGEISEYGRIIHIADIYEALTHGRSYRKKYLPYDAIKEIITLMPTQCDPVLLKSLIAHIGIYPIGSWVELNTNEIGRVIAIDEDFPLRPVITIIFNSSREMLDEPRMINLAKQYNIYIKKSLSDNEVTAKTKHKK